MSSRWRFNPQQPKTTHTKQDNGFLDEYYWDRKHSVLFRWWHGRGWVRTSTHISEVARVQRPVRQRVNPMKTCCTCKETMARAFFGKCASRKDELQSQCKVCAKNYRDTPEAKAAM